MRLVGQSGVFDAVWYKNTYQNGIRSGVDPLRHYLKDGWRQGCNPNPFFDTDWYLSRNGDVRSAGVNPLVHYLRYGAAEGRDPCGEFDTCWYLAQNPDVREAGLNPLVHYIKHGASEGRAPSPRQPGRVVAERWATQFDRSTERGFLAQISARYEAAPDAVDAIAISIVMPVYNREELVGRAIRSVIGQSHSNWQLIVVDDGSTDETRSKVSAFTKDDRITLIAAGHGGVSSARNRGLERATGDLIAYLDSDNVWLPHHLRCMAVTFTDPDVQCAFGAMRLEDVHGDLLGFRGKPYDWHDNLAANDVDLNVFCHRAVFYGRHGGFDERLKRMVDWDFILRLTKDCGALYLPTVTCCYRDDRGDRNRVSVTEHVAYRALVRAKHSSSMPEAVGWRDVLVQAKYRVALKIAAPEDQRQQWGDYHFAKALKQAFEAQGHSCGIDFAGQWYDRDPRRDDIVIVLRGLERYEPQAGHINILWNISHPDQVSYDEMERYDLVYVASFSFAAFLKLFLTVPVNALLQATALRPVSRIEPPGPAAGRVVFVGNTRGAVREVVSWAHEMGANLAVFGEGWQEVLPPSAIMAGRVRNEDLAKVYGQARAVLNDHWPSMRAFGFVSNRVFDVVACGGRLISDRIPSIGLLFGTSVALVEGPNDVRHALDTGDPGDSGNTGNTGEGQAERDELARRTCDAHGFATRADRILSDIGALIDGQQPDEDAEQLLSCFAVGRRAPLRVACVCRWGAGGPQSSAFIRLICPLTAERAAGQVQLHIHPAHETLHDWQADVCIVQRAALDDQAALDTLLRKLDESGCRLVVDTDDGFDLIDVSHPEHELFRQKAGILDQLIRRADQLWVSTATLQNHHDDTCGDVNVVPNMLDQRIWRDFRHEAPYPGRKRPLKFVYMGTATHDADFAMILSALDRLAKTHSGQFRVSIVGAVTRPVDRPWIEMVPVPQSATAYPRFVRWLRQQGPFDLGLAPLVDTPFNRCKSDIKLLDYSALGVAAIASDLPPYHFDSELARLVQLVPGMVDDWHAALAAACDGFAPLAERAVSARQHVWHQREAARMTGLQVGLLEGVAGKAGNG